MSDSAPRQLSRYESIKQQLTLMQSQFAAALPKHLSPERFCRVAITALTRVPKLAQCTPASFMRCLLDLSAFGLEPDGRRAHLIPYENRKEGTTECQLIIDWKGKAELAMRSGVVSNLHADVVCENDVFSYNRGVLEEHKIDFRKPRGAMFAAYALCRFKDGTEACAVLGKEEVDKIRSRSRASGAGPWVTDYNEMAKKTAFHRLAKSLPLSAEFRDAADHDDDETRPTPPAPAFIDVPASESLAIESTSAATDPGDAPADGIAATAKLSALIEESGWDRMAVQSAMQALKLIDARQGLGMISETKAAQIVDGWENVSGAIAAQIAKQQEGAQ